MFFSSLVYLSCSLRKCHLACSCFFGLQQLTLYVVLFSGMALADILLDIEYVPFILYTHFPHLIGLDNSWEKNSWGWAVYMIFHAHFSVIIHNVSIWLTLSVAIWRFIMIRFVHLVPVYCTTRRCHILLFSAYGEF